MISWSTHAIGITGAALILFGFIRVNLGKWNNKSVLYELDNFLGALLLAIYDLRLHAYEPLLLNVVWAVAALTGIESIRKRRAKAKK